MEGGRIKILGTSISILFFGAVAARAFAFPVDLKTYPSHSRLTIQVPDGVPTQWKSTSTGFELLVPNLGLVDLGLPPKVDLKSYRDERVDGISVKEMDTGVQITGRWLFPQGERALADPKMETFQFHQKNPSSVVIDFWVRAGLSVKEKKILDTKKHRTQVVEEAQKRANDRYQRRVASQKILKQNTDPARFCDEPLSDEQDVWLEFRPVHRTIDFGRWLPRTTPDSEFPYLEPKTDDLESQYVRLALKLYREGNYALAMRTIDFFDKEFPKSSRRSELNFLRGNALIKLNMIEEALSHFKAIVANEKGSPVALHSGMYIGRVALERAEYLSASEIFLTLIKDFPKHRLNWVFHLGAAEAYYYMRQTDRSAKEYRWVIENAPTETAKAEAAFRMGDLYLERRQHALALAAYFNAYKYFGDEAPRFPEVALNRAESLYWLGQHSRAESEFRKYLENHGQDPDSWRARWRMAELLGRTGPRGKNEAYRGYLLETVNTHPFSTSAKLARLLLMSCGDHAGFSKESMDLFVKKELDITAEDPVIFWDRLPSLVLLARARALVSFDADREAVELLSTQMHGPKIKSGKAPMEQLMKLAFRENILNEIKAGKGFRAIAFYKNFWNLLPKDKTDLEPDFLIQLSLVASDLQLGGMSLTLLDQYDLLYRLIYGQRTQSDVMDGQSLDEKLVLSEQNFATAKALWTAYGVSAETKIQQRLASIVSESPYSYESKLLQALILESKGKLDEAIKSVSQAELLVPSGDRQAYQRTQAFLSRLYGKQGNRMAAIQIYRKLAQTLEDKSINREPSQESSEPKATDSLQGLPGIPRKVDVIKAEAELLEKENLWQEAAQKYSEAIEIESKDAALKFAYARALERAGNWPKAEDVLKELTALQEKTFWSQLAQDVLDNKSLGVR